jgi:hypothetical protein
VTARRRTKRTVDIISACADPQLFAKQFRDPSTWKAWHVYLRALFGLPMDLEDRELFQQCTGRSAVALGGYRESWLICGRRSGKSRVLSLVAVYLATFFSWREYLASGEQGTIMVVAQDRRQAGVIFKYVRALLRDTPMLRAMIERETSDSIDLTNGISIEIQTASYRSIRGYTVVAALCDEIAFWRSDESSNPDSEIIAAIRPAMSTIPNAMLLCASSPYARRGVFWNAYRRHYGNADSAALIWKAATRVMNPTVPQSVIDEAIEEDAASAAAEYGAEFRTDIESYVAREVVDAAVVPGRHELPRMSSVYSYAAFVDPSGGSADSMTLAIAHRDADNRGVLDAIREVRPPFSPDSVVEEFSALLQSYGLREVEGDRYAGEWPAERFRAHSIEYKPAERSKSDIYRDFLPILNSRRAELLDHPRLANQICQLERRTARGGRDSIDHPPGGHDDLANAVAGVMVRVAGEPSELETWIKLGEAA